MILLIDPEISYLEQAKQFLEKRNVQVLIAEEQREFVRLCFDFQEEIHAIVFDSTRIEINPSLQEGLEYALRYAEISGVKLIEWNLFDWLEYPRKKQIYV